MPHFRGPRKAYDTANRVGFNEDWNRVRLMTSVVGEDDHFDGGAGPDYQLMTDDDGCVEA